MPPRRGPPTQLAYPASPLISKMAAFDPPYDGGGRGMFPLADALINWAHPLAANLVFFAVPVPYGYFDLVKRQPMPHQALSKAGAAPEQSSVQLFSQTPLGFAAWSYGNGTTNPRGGFARTLGSQPNYNSTSMTIAASCWSFPYSGGYSGTVDRLITATCGTDNNGVLHVSIANTAGATVGGNGAAGGVNADLTNINNLQTTHCLLGSFDGTTLLAQRDNNLSSTSNQSARAPLAGIDRITIGDATANACGRPIFWGAVWNTALSSTLRSLVTASDGNVSRNPLFGQIPRGLLIPRPFKVRGLHL